MGTATKGFSAADVGAASTRQTYRNIDGIELTVNHVSYGKVDVESVLSGEAAAVECTATQDGRYYDRRGWCGCAGDDAVFVEALDAGRPGVSRLDLRRVPPTGAGGVMAMQTVLRENTVYVAGDRFVCASTRCAGVTAAVSGRDIDGHALRAVDARDVAEWWSYDLGALRCECGSVTAKGGE